MLSADAFVTTKQESAYAVITQRKEINGPPAYFTIDWRAAEDSVELLESLRPEVVVSGHGRPMEGSKMRKQLRMLVHHFEEKALPKHGRYVNQPAIADERGIIDVPPSVTDSLPRVLAGVGLAALAATTTYLLITRQSRKPERNYGRSRRKAGNGEQQDETKTTRRKTTTTGSSASGGAKRKTGSKTQSAKGGSSKANSSKTDSSKASSSKAGSSAKSSAAVEGKAKSNRTKKAE